MGSINYSYSKTYTKARIMKSFYFSENCQEFSQDSLELASVFFLSFTFYFFLQNQLFLKKNLVTSNIIFVAPQLLYYLNLHSYLETVEKLVIRDSFFSFFQGTSLSPHSTVLSSAIEFFLHMLVCLQLPHILS